MVPGTFKKAASMRVLIDEHSGCCNGVGRAIAVAEDYLAGHERLYSLGSIVHNDEEIHRLEEKGLRTVSCADFPSLAGSTVLIRAHGEPPSTYALAGSSGIRLIDCTCPVVLALQKRIAAKYAEMSESGGTVIIFGKRGHAEVNGLVGQTDGHAVVVENLEDLRRCLESGAVDPSRPMALFSQTTKDPEEFSEIAAFLRGTVPGCNGLQIFDTICRHVSSRHKALRTFSEKCDVVIFVCGRESSNGKVLYELCRSVNPRSYKVESAADIPSGIFRKDDTVGICGATSTMRWQLEKVAETVSEISAEC